MSKVGSRTKPVLLKPKLDLLLSLYRFRFGSPDLLARSVGLKDGRYIYTRIEALVSDGYVGKNYDKSYKLLGKPASYYLTRDTFKALNCEVALAYLLSQRCIGIIYKDRGAYEHVTFYTIAMETFMRWEHLEEELWLMTDWREEASELRSIA